MIKQYPINFVNEAIRMFRDKEISSHTLRQDLLGSLKAYVIQFPENMLDDQKSNEVMRGIVEALSNSNSTPEEKCMRSMQAYHFWFFKIRNNDQKIKTQ